MTAYRSAAAAACAAMLAIAGNALAQPQSLQPEPVEEETLAGPAASETPAPSPEEQEWLDGEDSADLLNSQQQLQQSFTLERTIDGKVVETERRTVVISPNDPIRTTEAGMTARDRLIAMFDGEVLTRTEAVEEAKLDFTIADLDRDGAMTAEEFAALVKNWREMEAPQTDARPNAPDAETARQRQYEAFLAEINPQAAEQRSQAHALEKFALMSGAAETMSRKDYIRAYIKAFDAADADQDALLKDEELFRFRARNRGKTIEE